MKLRSKSSLFALLSALSVAAVAIILHRYSVSDICGWYLTASEAPSVSVDSVDLMRSEPEGERMAACQLSGNVPHCGCSYAAVESMNLNSMRSILSELVQTPFFRYFKTVRAERFVVVISALLFSVTTLVPFRISITMSRRRNRRISCASALFGPTTGCAR